MHVPREAFEQLVARALEEIPEHFRERLENVEVLVEQEPRPEHFGVETLPPGVTFFGLYHGLPMLERASGYSFALPDRILIFQGPIERACRTRRQLIEAVRDTVRHELAHYFGTTDARLEELGR